MGRWFPGFRPATPEQVSAYREAERERYRNERHEGKARIRTETERYHRLNDRAGEAEKPLSRTQQWWHRNRAATEVDRDFTRLQRASDRQDRARRRSTR
jgi:hypothetical protein